MNELVTALALVLVIEGALWALFPDAMKRAAALALSMADGRLRTGGLVAAALGVFMAWLLRG